MNVFSMPMTVMEMLPVPTFMEDTSACAIGGLPAMEKTAQGSTNVRKTQITATQMQLVLIQRDLLHVIAIPDTQGTERIAQISMSVLK